MIEIELKVMKSILSKMFLLIGGAALTLMGCSPSGNRSSTTPITDTVTISGMEFHPSELYVNKGDTVVWINQDIVAHNVTEFPDGKWASDTIEMDHSWRRVMDKNTDYFCSIHPTMKGKVQIRQ